MPDFDDLPTDSDDLSTELQLLLMSNLGATDASNLAASPSDKIQTLASNQNYWKDRLEVHFPRVFESLRKNKGDIKYVQAFEKACETEYAGLSLEQRDLFSFVKDGDIDRLEEFDIQKKDLLSCDKHDLNLLDWANKNEYQFILNYFLNWFALNDLLNQCVRKGFLSLYA